MNWNKFHVVLILFLLCLGMGTKTYAQQNSTDSLKAARQRVSDSTRQALQQHTDSMRIARQQSLDSSKKVTQHRTDSLAAIRKYKESKRYTDSMTRARNAAMKETQAARQRVTDSMKAARQQIQDSTIAARRQVTDSMQKRMKSRTDSLARITKYRNSKRYQDSVAKARNQHIDSMRRARTIIADSAKAVRKHALDSTMAARKQVTDSMRSRQKIRTDSMAVIRKYKESKRYRDSVAVTRQLRLDSMKAVRKKTADSLMAIRKTSLDSAKASRKAILDSTMAIRKKSMDSLKAIRELKADSLAKAKELRLKNQKVQAKKKEEKAKMAFELKIKKKHEAYSNEKMLKKKWTLVRQGFQNTYTRYNYYFNAKRKMTEAQENMVRRKKDDFERLIDLFPFDPNLDSTVFASDMDTIIRKASVGIQIHDPRTKWGDDLYLLMGQSYYYKGDYESAAATFRYIIGMKNRNLKKKKKPSKTKTDNSLVQKEKGKIARLLQHKPAHNDAVLWLTRTFTDSKRQGDAEAILDLLDASTGLSESMKGKIALEKANLQVRRGAYKEASRQLELVVKSPAISKYTRQRAAFLNGQLLYNMGEYTAAAASYQKALNLHPQIEMDFYARKNLAGSIALGGGDQTKSIASLKSILHDGKYAPYHEQVYFLLGQLSANDGRDEEALTYYTKSLQLPKTSKKQKAITFAAVGNIHYRTGQYNLAKRDYDSASFFAKHAGDNTEVAAAILRGKSLDKIEEPYTIMVYEDSLLRLAAMTEKDQRAVVKKYIRYLEKSKADSIARTQNTGNNAPTDLGTSGGGMGGTTSSWYFSSQATVQQGYNDFKRKWGGRPLTDNWRRSSASSYGNEVVGINGSQDSTADEEDENGLPSEASLLAAIPRTENQMKDERRKLRKAYINLADAYIRNLEDYPAGVRTLDTLDRRFPDHEYADQVLSLRYQVALRQNKPDTAEQLRRQLLTNYPNSTYAKALAANSTDSIAAADQPSESTVAEYYQETYRLSDERQYTEVLQRVGLARRKYSDASYSRKFTILEASSLAGLGSYKKADTVIKAYLKEYPSDSLKPWADAISRRIADLKAADTLHRDTTATAADTTKAGTAKPGMADSVAKAAATPDKYIYKAAEPHYVIFLFGKPDVKTAGFKSGLNDFGTIKFSGLKLLNSLEMIGPDRSMVTTKGFANAGQARIFMKAALAEPLLFRDLEKGSYQSYLISESNFTKLITDKDPAAYISFYNKYYK